MKFIWRCKMATTHFHFWYENDKTLEPVCMYLFRYLDWETKIQIAPKTNKQTNREIYNTTNAPTLMIFLKYIVHSTSKWFSYNV